MAIKTKRQRHSNFRKFDVMSDTKKQTDLKPVITNKKDNQKAGYGGRTKPTEKDRELDEPKEPDTHDDGDRPKKFKNDNPNDRELDEETDAGDASKKEA